MRGKFNFLQKTMLDWNELHPYNAAHVLRVPEKLDLERLKKTIGETLEFHGLTGLALDGKKSFQFSGGAAQPEIKILSGENIQETLRSEIEHQLNTPFEIRESFLPFRFFVTSQPDCFFLGLIYFHPIADAVAVVYLLRDIFDSYVSKKTISKRFIVERGFQFSPARFFSKIAAFPAAMRTIRQSHKARYDDENDCSNGLLLLSLTPQHLRALSVAGKMWNVTINDLLLAMLMKCCAPFAEDRASEPRRRRIAIGSIVNIRKELGLDERAFGLFLGSFFVSHEVPDGISLRDLAADVRQQTLAIKEEKLFVGPAPEMLLGRLSLSFFSTAKRKKLYQKNYPLWGGITNMNLNALWPQQPEEKPVDYFRAVSTGPVTPLVLSVTTLREVMNIGLSYRRAVFSKEQIEQVCRDFLGMIEGLKK
jgi:hypothetical protein